MGCFSWCLIDTRQELVMGQPFKFLIPEEFGGGEVVTSYDDYGCFHYEGKEYDMYEILAAWNGANITLEEHGLVPTSKDTDDNRGEGINIGCYDHDIAKLTYPLRLVSIMDTKTYEDYDGMFSIGARMQGWDGHTIYNAKLFKSSHYNKNGGNTT